MKTPKFETSTGALIALLATRTFVWADLYTFSTVLGQTLRYCTADVDISYSGFTFPHNGPLFDRTDGKAVAHWKVGLDVDTWQVVIMPRTVDPLTGATYPDTIGSTPWATAVRAGALDAAVVTVDRAFLPAWPTRPYAGTAVLPTGVVNIFTGRVADCDVGRTQVGMNINSHLELLGVMMPRRLYQAACPYLLFDVDCTLNAATFAKTGTALAGSGVRQIVSNVAAPTTSGGNGTYALGRVVMTSGANNGFTRGIQSWSGPGAGNTITLRGPFFSPVQAGDTFTVYPGCNKTQAACTDFGNLANFGGESFIPAPEVAV